MSDSETTPQTTRTLNLPEPPLPEHSRTDGGAIEASDTGQTTGGVPDMPTSPAGEERQEPPGRHETYGEDATSPSAAPSPFADYGNTGKDDNAGEEENVGTPPAETPQQVGSAGGSKSSSKRFSFTGLNKKFKKTVPGPVTVPAVENPEPESDNVAPNRETVTPDDTSSQGAHRETPEQNNVDDSVGSSTLFSSLSSQASAQENPVIPAAAPTAPVRDHGEETLFGNDFSRQTGMSLSSSPKKYVGKTFVEAAEIAFASGLNPRFYNALTGIPYSAAPPPDGSIIIRVAQNGNVVHLYCNPNRMSSTPFTMTQDDDDTTTRRRGKKSPLKIAMIVGAVIVGLLLATGTGMFIMTKIKEATKISVPNIVSQEVPAATAVLAKDDATLGQVTEISSADIPKGTIVSQNPTAGTKVSKGSAVDVIVSSGPQQNTVPKLVGLTQAQAETTLKTANFTLGAVTQKDDPAPVGTIVGQNPLPDTKVNENTPVDLVLSNGKIGVPNVIGKNLEEASVALATAGFKVKPVPVTQQGPAGIVVLQNPAATTLTDKGTEVQIVYTTPPVVATPAPTPTPATPAPATPAPATPAPATPAAGEAAPTPDPAAAQ